MEETSKEMEKYFISIQDKVNKYYDIAEKARKKGKDPQLFVESPQAKDLAGRVEKLVGPEGVADLIRLLKPYQRKLGYDFKFEWDKIALKYMIRSKKILDIGCGEGRFIGHSTRRIIGVDHNQKSLAICKKKGFNVKYSKVTKLPFGNESFDAVHCSHVIEHLLPRSH